MQTLNEPPAPVAKVARRFVPTSERKLATELSLTREETARPPSETASGNMILDDEVLTRPLSEMLEHGWALHSKCAPVPEVQWWQYRTHVSIASYVNLKHGGDWKAYSESWLLRLAKLQDIYERKSSAVTRTGIILQEEELQSYIRHVQMRISVIHCLAEEAKVHAGGKKIAA